MEEGKEEKEEGAAAAAAVLFSTEIDAVEEALEGAVDTAVGVAGCELLAGIAWNGDTRSRLGKGPPCGP